MSPRAFPNIKAGDAVYGLPAFDRDGAAAEYVVVRHTETALKPSSVDFVQAATIPLSALTAWQAFCVQGHLSAGQRVLIHGGAGGVGSFAVQLAKHLGAETIATTSTANAGFVKQLGADRVIDYRTSRSIHSSTIVDLVLDTVGGETLARSWRTQARRHGDLRRGEAIGGPRGRPWRA